MAEFTKQIRDFFKETGAGELVLKELYDLIEVKHTDAERNPDHARDHTQRALGIRDALQAINSLTMEAHKPNTE